MEIQKYTHLQLHEKFQHIVQHALSDDAEKMKAIKFLFSQEPQIWKSALISAYCHLAEDRMRVDLCANAKHDLFQFTQNALAGNLPFHISQTSPDEFANLVFSNLKDECKITLKADFERIKQCISLAQTHGPESGAGLTLSDMWCLLKGLAFTLLYHPTFFDESRRENMIALMADRVVEDLNGPWPTTDDPREGAHQPPATRIAVQHSIQRTHKASLWGAMALVKQEKMPVDEWMLHIDGIQCHVLNHWKNGHCQFVVNEEVVAENNEKLAIFGKTPFLTAQIQGVSGQRHKVEVFVRAILSVNIRAHVNGLPIQKKFM